MQKTWITWKRNITFLQNNKILNLCLRWHILRSYHFVTEATFKGHTQRMERNNWISRCRTLRWIFWKKKKSLKSNILEAHKALKILVVTISSHIISFHFLPISAQLKKTKIGRFEAEEVAVTGEKLFCLSQKERFLEPIEKNPYIVNYWWAEVSNYICSTILVITKIYIFLLYFTSVLLLIMRSQPASNINIYS